MDVTPDNITFTWEHVSHNCPGLYYNIVSMRCGTCPSGTEIPRITCSGFQKNGSTCILMIQSVLCWETNASINGTAISKSLFLKGTCMYVAVESLYYSIIVQTFHCTYKLTRHASLCKTVDRWHYLLSISSHAK
jgi:hypothetical protein